MSDIELKKIVSDNVQEEVENQEEKIIEDKKKEFYRAMLDDLSLQEEG
jgi:hypothetical protein